MARLVLLFLFLSTLSMSHDFGFGESGEWEEVEKYEKREDKEALVRVISGEGFSYLTKVKKPQSYLKEKHLVKQELDFSCGSAAVATIFNYYLGEHVTEKEVIEGLFKVGNVKKIIKRKAFSLLDIKKFAEYKGYKAVGYRTDVKGLVKLGKPAIVTLELGNYKHFVVFRGVRKGRVFLADPALGNTILSVEEFERMWYKNIALVIEPKEEPKENRLAITDEDMQWVQEEKVRQYIGSYDIITPKLPVDF